METVFVYSDAGRLFRPVFYNDEKLSLKNLSKEHTTWEKLVHGKRIKNADGQKIAPTGADSSEWANVFQMTATETVKDVMRDNSPIIDYIDTSETENALISFSVAEFETAERGKHYSHCEIHESLIFGPMFNLIAFPEHNAQQRDLFSCSQSKQAVSLYHTNFSNRMDKNGVVLNAGQNPLVKSRFLEYITHEENTYGVNTIVAIMSYTGYNVEDSILVNEGSLKRGLFRTTYYSTYQAQEEVEVSSSGVRTERVFADILGVSEGGVGGVVVRTKPGYDYSALDETGIVRENTPVTDHLIMMGMATRSISGASAGSWLSL
jgi:DNA-directed RNA polymerase beta subunit